jgi:hypothetical protein
MGFFQAMSDFEFMTAFRGSVLELWQIESTAAEELRGAYLPLHSEYQAALQSRASEITNYQQVRERVARGMLRAMRIARRLKVPIDWTSYPAPAVGGPVIPVNLFASILKDTSHGGIGRQQIYDALTQTVGECETQLSIERRRLLNPFYWVKEAFIAIIRIPFMLVEASGFDVGKVEDHFLAKAFKLVEIVAIVYILLHFGIGKDEIRQAVTSLFSK